MFRVAWDAKRDKAKEIARAGRRQIKDLDKQMNSLLDRIVDATNPT